MFGNDHRDLAATLTQMERVSREKTSFNQVEAKQKMAEWLANDRRFDEFDKDRLVARVQECRSTGGVLDLADPRLKGLEPRPLERRY